jgi:hypothetical protein
MPEIIKPTDFPVFDIGNDNTPEQKGEETIVEPGTPQGGPEVIDPINDPKPDPTTIEVDDRPIDDEEEEEIFKKEEPGESENLEVEAPEADENGEISPIAQMQYALALGILEAPEGFEINEEDPETSAQELIDYNRNLNYSQAEQELLGQIQDPLLVDLIKHGINGGKFFDAKQFFEGTQQEIEYSQINLEEKENQVAVYRDYLKKTSKFSDNKINKIIDMLDEEGELQNEANNAVQFFVEDGKQRKEQAAQEARQRAEQERRINEQRQQSFMDSLTKSGYSRAQQQRILNSFNNVELENGQQVREFEYKMLQLQDNPDHFIEFLTLLNEYDPSQGFTYNRVERKKEATATKKVYERFKEAASYLPGGKGHISGENKPIVPRRNPYLKNVQRF